MFYYKGTKVMRGISISLHGDSSEISFRGKPGEAGIEKIDLSELKNVLQRQDISIYVSRDSVHWRDAISFYIEPKHWKKKRIISSHTYH